MVPNKKRWVTPVRDKIRKNRVWKVCFVKWMPQLYHITIGYCIA